MRIDPISVKDLSKFDWYHSVDHNTWYYYRNKKSFDFDSDNLNDTLDPDIKKINNLLTGSGFKTVPSCQGHNRNEKFIHDTFENLLKDKDKIKRSGLLLKNCENNNYYILIDKHWELPFTFEEFHEIMTSESVARGYMGFYLNDISLVNKLNHDLENITGIDCVYSLGLLEIFNNVINPKTRKSNWNKIYNILNKYI